MTDLAGLFHRKLMAALNEAIATEANSLVRGLAKDHADYRHRCGQVRGLETAKTLAEEALKSLFADDDQET